jgi:hypothetical protein
MEEESLSGYYIVEITRAETGWAFDPVWAFEETWFNFHTDTLAHATTYYHVAADGLYLAGYDGTGDIQPSSGDESYRFRINDRDYNSLGELLLASSRPRSTAALSPDVLVVEDPFKQALKYPIAIGAEWVFRTDNPWRIEKSVDEFEIIDVPAGSFGCFVVRSREDRNGDGDFTESPLMRDYVAEQGLVRRSHIRLDVMVQSQGGDWRFVDIIDEYELVAWE